MRSLSLALAAVAALLASCTSFQFDRQVLALRALPEEDVLEARIVYVDVHGRSSASRRAVEALSSLAAGGPPVILFGWPFEFDPDGLPDEDDVESPADALAREVWLWLASFEVQSAGLVADGDRVHAWQELSWSGAGEGLETVDRAISAFVIEELGEPRGDGGRPDAPFTDPASIERFLGAARDPSFSAFDADGSLRVSFPATLDDLAELLPRLSGEDAAFAGPPPAVEHRRGVASLVVEPDAAGWVELATPSRDDAARRESVAEPLREQLSGSAPAWVREALD